MDCYCGCCHAFKNCIWDHEIIYDPQKSEIIYDLQKSEIIYDPQKSIMTILKKNPNQMCNNPTFGRESSTWIS